MQCLFIRFSGCTGHGQSVKLDFRKARIQYKGVSAPTESCSLESFAQAEAYRPLADDVRKRIAASTVKEMKDSGFPLPAVYRT